MKYKLSFLFLLFFSLQVLPCEFSKTEYKNLLNLDYETFDQTFGKGWRKYADLECYDQTGRLIDDYLQKHFDNLVRWQQGILVWHAGQMYAYDGNYKIAKLRFLASLDQDEPKDTPILWNDYVYASVAFLEGDLLTLKYHREVIANGPKFEDKIANLHVVDNLINCFSLPYKNAYSSCKK
ncbi:MAG: hypothetical protein HOE90_12995 [Bacteriovoracaceae bacterium]|nr:hypothetical protein [Bacteriovoracaceae bacterium]